MWLRAKIAVLIAVAGALGGAGLYTFVYAKGYSYFSSDPKACINCHAMQPQFDAWVKSTHHAVAKCNDCHMPHDNAAHKLFIKANNGFWHSYYFTTGDYPDNIRITPRNRAVAEAACRSCHGEIVHAVDRGGGLSCLQCHDSVGHAR